MKNKYLCAFWLAAIPFCLAAENNLQNVFDQYRLDCGVVIDPFHNQTAAWMDNSDGGLLRIRAALRPSGGVWSAPEWISFNSSFVLWPKIAVNSVGSVIVAWNEFGHRPPLVKYSSLDLGGAWSQPAVAASDTVGVIDSSLGMDRNGNAIVLWTNGTLSRIQAAFYLKNENTWSAPINLDLKTQIIPAYCLSVADDGHFLIVWNRQIGFDSQIMALQGKLGEPWGEPVEVTPTGTVGLRPFCSLNSAGDAIVAWTDSSAEEPFITIHAACYSAEQQKWGLPERLSVPDGHALYAKTVLNDEGMGAVIWSKSTENGQILQSSILPQGCRWNPVLDLSSASSQIPVYNIAINSHGLLICCWQSSNGGMNSIYQSVYSQDQMKWQDSSVVSGPEGGITPFVAVDDENRAVLLWMALKNNSILNGVDFDIENGWGNPYIISK